MLNHEDIYLWWDDIGRVKISKGNQITVDQDNPTSFPIMPFLLGPVMAILLHQRGFLVLHGSSIKSK